MCFIRKAKRKWKMVYNFPATTTNLNCECLFQQTKKQQKKKKKIQERVNKLTTFFFWISPGRTCQLPKILELLSYKKQ